MSRVFRSQPAPLRRIKPAQAAMEPRKAEVLPDPREIVAEAREEAEAILEEARRQAQSIVEEARAESERIAEAAREAGRNDGYVDGHEKGLAEAQHLVDEAQAALQAARDAYGEMLAESEPRLLALVVEVGRKVLGDAFAQDPGVILGLIRKGIAALRDEREFSVRVPPELVSLVEGETPVLRREYGARSIDVVGDPEVTGGAIVLTPHGFVDVTIESQIRAIATALAEARKKALGIEVQ